MADFPPDDFGDSGAGFGIGTAHIPPDQRRGRGAGSNAVGRFERYDSLPVDDGWPVDDAVPPLRTEVAVERPRSIITRNTSPDLPFDRSINPYRGCEHGCIYCYARPTHAYLGLSPGLDFETKLIARPDAPQVLERELRQRAYKVAPIAIGTNTDPYQPVEKTRMIMRDCLQVLSDFNHPLTITTKGTLVERDNDILAPMAAKGLVEVGISITTLDPQIARVMEPRVPAPARRLQVIRRLVDAGIPVRIMASPLIPALTDHELEAILHAGAEAGATRASYILVRLPLEVAPLFRDWLSQHFPDRAARVMGRIRALHGGQDYAADFATRMSGQGEWAKLTQARYQIALRKTGLERKAPPLNCALFAPPFAIGAQMSLF